MDFGSTELNAEVERGSNVDAPYSDMFAMVLRPLYASVASSLLTKMADAAEENTSKSGFAELASGPYFDVARFLGASSLCALDASCATFGQLNKSHLGPWRDLGTSEYHGLELERDGGFDDDLWDGKASKHGLQEGIDWKKRFCHFAKEAPTFCAPFGGPQIVSVADPDEVAYFNCRFCTDLLEEPGTHGVYLEVEVLANWDNLSMAVVDFEAGGCSSVTFSPDTGAVIHESKVKDDPRQVYGAYVQPLPTVPPGHRFHGCMGLYLFQGRIAFFRRCSPATFSDGAATSGAPGEPEEPEEEAAGNLNAMKIDAFPGGVAPWETTGFVSGLTWAEGRRLTPCLAFRDEGPYQVRVVRVGGPPPFQPEASKEPGGLAATGGRGSDARRAPQHGHGEPGWNAFDREVAPAVTNDVRVGLEWTGLP